MKKVIVLMLGGVFLLSGSAFAQPIDSDFSAEVVDGAVVGGTGEWYYYEDSPSGPWWNTWFYDHPPDATRWKEVDLNFCVTGLDAATAEVTINWSTMAWPETGPGGPFFPRPGDEIFIERLVDYGIDIPIDPIDPETSIGSFVGRLPAPYNPEWVSIDIRGVGDFVITGSLIHDCVPEPATMSLLVLGGLVALLRRRR